MKLKFNELLSPLRRSENCCIQKGLGVLAQSNAEVYQEKQMFRRNITKMLVGLIGGPLSTQVHLHFL